MKRGVVITVVAALALGLGSICYAKYVSGYKIVEVGEKQVTIQKGEEAPVAVSVEKGEYKVGDKVKFDADKLKIRKTLLRKLPAGC